MQNQIHQKIHLAHDTFSGSVATLAAEYNEVIDACAALQEGEDVYTQDTGNRALKIQNQLQNVVQMLADSSKQISHLMAN